MYKRSDIPQYPFLKAQGHFYHQGVVHWVYTVGILEKRLIPVVLLSVKKGLLVLS